MADRRRVAIIGVGNLPVLAPVLASVAQYFGERTLEVRLWDPSSERVDVAQCLAFRLFRAAGAMHKVYGDTNIADALAGASDVVSILDPDMLTRFSQVELALEQFRSRISVLLSEDARVLSVAGLPGPLPSSYVTSWPTVPEGAEHRLFPHQVLRWIREDEHPFEILAANEKTSLSDWLDGHLDDRVAI